MALLRLAPTAFPPGEPSDDFSPASPGARRVVRQRRRIRIWGSGSARHAIAELLEAAGTPVDDRVASLELIRRASVPDFIVVATADHDGTTRHLESLGFQLGIDYSVVEPHLFHALSLSDRHAGAA